MKVLIRHLVSHMLTSHLSFSTLITINEPLHKSLVLMPLITLNMHAQLPSGARGLNFGSSLHLCSHFVSSKDSSDAMSIGVAPITQLRMCVIKIVTFKGGHLML